MGEVVTCLKCGVSFAMTARKVRMRLRRCDDCHRAYLRDHYRRTVDVRRAQLSASRAKRPEHWVAEKARKRTPVEHAKALARQAVNRAIQYGRMMKGPCARCGSTDRVQAHHDDYAKRYEVTWLCSFCHAEQHRLEREQRVVRASESGSARPSTHSAETVNAVPDGG